MTCELAFDCSARCAGCDWRFDEWEQRTAGAQKLSERETDDVTEFLLETAKRCPRCLSCRVTLRFGIDAAE